MIITLNEYVRTDLEGYSQLIKVINQVEQNDSRNVVFDFEKVLFFEANLSAVLGIAIEILERKKASIYFINLNNKIETILRKNEFLIPFGFNKIHDHYDTAIKYQKFSSKLKEDEQNFEQYIKTQLLGKAEFPSHSKALGKQITLRIFELYENAKTHGACNYIHACGQYFPNKKDKPLNITIVDTGKTIKELVGNYLKKDISGEDAIEWAMKKGHTTKTKNISGGLGLDLIYQFIQHNRGKIQIISNDGYWEWHRGLIIKKRLSEPFQGTIANLRFNLNDKSHYMLRSETNTSWENLF